MRARRSVSTPAIAAALALAALTGRPAAAGSGNDPDVRAIEAVVAAFQHAIAARDGTALVGLLVQPDVPFSRITDDARVFTDTGSEFAGELLAATATQSEQFSDVVITPRNGLATVDANYRYLVDGAVTNHGREIMTLTKTAKGWRIASAIWTGAGAPTKH